jgi:hypothetical protein
MRYYPPIAWHKNFEVSVIILIDRKLLGDHKGTNGGDQHQSASDLATLGFGLGGAIFRAYSTQLYSKNYACLRRTG